MKNDLTLYDFPRELKEMSYDELDILSYAIRDFLVEKVAVTGGHLASNLGVVELSIALHRVFDSPKDKLIWDVGHQSYVHKILTGRAAGFDSLRKTGGMSGFPKVRESEHDCYETGHSSTSLSAAAGMAAARDLKGEDYDVVATIGDGSLTGGMAFEALNNIGSSRSKVIVIINDNEMSISRNIGGMTKHLAKLRTSSKYLTTKKTVKNVLKSVPLVGKDLEDIIGDTKNWLKYTLMSGGILFEEFGFKYFGPVDGHDIRSLCTVLEQAKKVKGPVAIHVITKKGKGYFAAEENPDRFHGIGPFDINSGLALGSGGVSYSEVMGKSVLALAKKDTDICAITAAMGSATGLGDFSKEFKDRFFDVGIAEAHGVTFAAGLARAGMKPLVAIYSSFLQRAYDQIIEDVCLQDLPVVFALDRAGIVGADGETHHGVFDISYLSSIPNMTVLTPSDGRELADMIPYAFSLGTPVAIRYPRGNCPDFASSEELEAYLASDSRTEGPAENARVLPAGKADIWAVGHMRKTAEEAAAILKEKGISCGVVSVRSVKPFDDSLMDPAAELLVTLEDGVTEGGAGEHIAAVAAPGVRTLILGWPDRFIEHGSSSDLYRKYGLDASSVAERIYDELQRKA